jgi:hypothetical protein
MIMESSDFSHADNSRYLMKFPLLDEDLFDFTPSLCTISKLARAPLNSWIDADCLGRLGDVLFTSKHTTRVFNPESILRID